MNELKQEENCLLMMCHTHWTFKVTTLSMISFNKRLCQIGVVTPHITKKLFRQDKPPQDTHTAGTSTATWTFEEMEEYAKLQV